MSRERFIYLDQQGREVRLSDIEAVKAGMRHGTIRPDTLLFDSQAGGWSRAEFHPLYRQVIREVPEPLDLEGTALFDEERTGASSGADHLILESLGASLGRESSDEAPADDPLERSDQRRDEPVSRGPERQIRNRRRPPKLKKRPRAVVGGLVVAGLLVWGVGAVATRDTISDFALQAGEARPGVQSAPGRGRVVRPNPDLTRLRSSDLAVRIQQAIEWAHDDISGRLARMAEVDHLPARPPDAWLEGEYLADAGRYPEVPTYWRALGLWAGEVRVGLPRVVKEGYARRLAEGGFENRTAELLLMEALEDFRAAAPSRDEAFAGFREVIQAALDLHELLVENEASIEFEPFSRDRISRDPILEAVTSDPELEEAVWVGITRVTGALERMGTLNQPTTATLQRALLRRLESSLGGAGLSPRDEIERSVQDSEG